MEQPGNQDSGNEVIQPGDHNNDPLELDPVDPNPGDPDPDLDPPEEDEEIEVDGRKFALPKSAAEKLKAERLMQQDYTRKTQEVAESRKAVEAEREQVRQQAAQQQQYIKEVAKVTALDDQLEQFNQVDWNGLSQTDPALAQQLDFQRRDLERKREEAAAFVTQKQHENALAEQQNLAKQVQEADAYFKREIPGWSPERSTRLQQFATEQGLPGGEQLAKLAVQFPALAKVLHKAELMDQLEKKQKAKPNTPAAPPAPVTRVGASRGTAAKDPSKMSDAEWYRAEQERKRKR
jgi:hypothetical protein